MAYDWKGITVALDDTKGYGGIIELEKLTNEEEKEKELEELKLKMNELKIALSSREEFEDKFEYYLKNWKNLV